MASPDPSVLDVGGGSQVHTGLPNSRPLRNLPQRPGLIFRLSQDQCRRLNDELLPHPRLVQRDTEAALFQRSGLWNVAPRCAPALWAGSPLHKTAVQWDVTRVHARLPGCNLSAYLDNLVLDLVNNHVVLVESPTGAGKSVIAPFLAFKAAERLLDESTRSGPHIFSREKGFKCMLFTPTAAQVHQLKEHVRDYLLAETGQVVGGHTSETNLWGDLVNDVLPGQTNVAISTFFFARLALNNHAMINTVVVDEIHQMTPDLIRLLKITRQRLREGTVQRVILLSATLHSHHIVLLREYFEDSSFIHRCLGKLNFPINTIHIDNENLRGPIARAKKTGLPSPSQMFDDESFGDGTPSTEEMRLRAVAVSTSLMARMRAGDREVVDHFGDKAGAIVFCGGSGAVLFVAGRLRNELKSNPRGRAVELSHVSGQDRKGLKQLEREVPYGEQRWVVSTPLLGAGITLLGVNMVIDTGIERVPSAPNCQNVRRLEDIWIDGGSLYQRRGRVGRLEEGFYLPLFTVERYKGISNADNTQLKFDRSLSTAHSEILEPDSSGHFLKCSSQEILDTIYDTLRIQGGTNSEDGRVSPLATLINRAFINIPFDLGLLLLYGAQHGVLLPALTLVASITSNHPGVQRPRKGKGEKGRDEDDLAINVWERLTKHRDPSEMIGYTELILNLVVEKFKVNVLDEEGAPLRLNFDKKTEEWRSDDGLAEVWRAMRGLMSGLTSIGLLPGNDPDFGFSLHGTFIDEVANFRFLAIRGLSRDLLSSAITLSLGSRVMLPSRTAKGYQRNKYSCTGLPTSSSFPTQAQGERSGLTTVDHVAIYYELFVRSEKEPFSTGLLHQVPYHEYMLFGNGCTKIDENFCSFDSTNFVIHLQSTGDQDPATWTMFKQRWVWWRASLRRSLMAFLWRDVEENTYSNDMVYQMAYLMFLLRDMRLSVEMQ